MVASMKGHVEVVDRLIQRGARVDLQEKVKQLFPTPAYDISSYCKTINIGVHYILQTT